MTASYATEKLIKFELPNGRIYNQISTKDYKYLLTWKRSQDDDYKVIGTYKSKIAAEQKKQYFLKIGWQETESIIINRTSKQYLKNMTELEYYEALRLVEGG